MPLVNFSKKIWFFSFNILPEFQCSNIFAVTEYTQNQIFLVRYKKIFSQNFHFIPIRWVFRQFFKISIIYSQNLHFILVFLSNFLKIIACTCWAYVELILSHTEHTSKQFHRTLSIQGKILIHDQPTVKCDQFLHGHPRRVYAEQILLHTQHTRNKFHRWLSIRKISSLAEHTRKCLKVEYVGRIIYDFKNLVLQALGTIRFRFLKKSFKKIFNACVPSSCCRKNFKV